MKRPGDPLGHYARLGLAPWAMPVAIDAAFRARSREIHPDTDPALAEAYRVLSDERLRRDYDDGARAEIDGDGAEYPSARPQPRRPVSPGFGRDKIAATIFVMAALTLFGAVFIRAPSPLPTSPASALTPPPLPVPVRIEHRAVMASGVNLRMGPGTQHAPTSRIARGEIVELLEPESDGWVRVKLTDGRTGFIAARFLSTP